MKAQEQYPLPPEEQKALVNATILSELLWLAVFWAGATVLHGLATGDWMGALALAWMPDLLATLRPHWAMVALPVAMFAAAKGFQLWGQKTSPSFRAAKLELNQGLNGELPRLRTAHLVLCMCFAGICEELVFRYVLISYLMLLLSLFLPTAAAAAGAVVVSALVFWLVHFQYRNFWMGAIAFTVGLILGAGYVLSGSLLAVMFAHAAYNIAVVMSDRFEMVRDPDFFGGKVPVSFALDMAEKQASSRKP